MDDIETLEPEHLPGAAGRITREALGSRRAARHRDRADEQPKPPH